MGYNRLMTICNLSHSKGYDDHCHYDSLDCQPVPVEGAWFAIFGYHENGKPMRPSDWPHMLCGRFSTVEGGRVRYNENIRPAWLYGRQGVIITEGANPNQVSEVLEWAEAENLIILGP